VDPRAARTVGLGGAAVRLLAPLLKPGGTIPSLVLGIGDPAKLPGGSPGLLRDTLMRQAELRLRIESSEVLPPGRAAGLLAVHRAIERLNGGEPGPILAGGIDSYFDADRLEALDVAGRLLNDKNLDGFLPGEGAAILLLARGSTSAKGATSARPLGRLLAPSVGSEPGHLHSEQPLRGDGLSQTIAAALGAVSQDHLPCATIYANLNGERLGAKEWGVAQIRNKRFLAEDLHVVHPAECTGEAGAAMGPLLVALAAMSAAKRPGLALVWCSSDEAERAALCVAS